MSQIVDLSNAPALRVSRADDRSNSHTGGEGPSESWGHPRTLVDIGARQVRDIVADTVDAVAASNEPPWLFRRGPDVVRVERNDAGVGAAVPVPAGGRVNVLNAAVNFQRLRKGDDAWVDAKPDRDLIGAAFERLHGRLPLLRAVSTAPVLRDDGVLCAEPGFDATTGVYVLPPEGFVLPLVPDEPTGEDVKRALAQVLHPFGEMPFATTTDRAHFLAALLTAVLRSWFPTAPLFVIEAPVQGSGKTLLATALRVIVEGASGIGVAPETGKGSEAEWRKRVVSILLAAPSVAVIDNVTGRLGGATLSGLATSSSLSDRRLGENVLLELPNTATWIFTSNNAQVDADLIRRTVFVRLDADQLAPHLRSGFAIPDLLGHVTLHRARVLAGLYTLVRRWIALGRPAAPTGTPMLGSFEAWSRVLPAILAVAGVGGFLGDAEERARVMVDPDDEEAAEFLAAWHRSTLSDRATARALIDAGSRELAAALPLPEAVGASARSLGRWLLYRRDRWLRAADGEAYCVRAAGPDTSRRGRVWRVERKAT